MRHSNSMRSSEPSDLISEPVGSYAEDEIDAKNGFFASGLKEARNSARLEQPSAPLYETVRRVADLFVVTLSAPAVAITVSLCAMLIYFKMGRPVFFVQDRVGLGGRIFRIYKLRTMLLHKPAAPNSTDLDDARVTAVGRFLRLSHLDELPQIWNILIGDMTLIGPRPEQPELVEKYSSAIKEYERRNQLTPGLTGYAQVYYGYAATIEETKIKLAYDLYYLENRCAKLDLQILWRTLVVYSNSKYVR